MKRTVQLLSVCALFALASGVLLAQVTGEVLGEHDLTPRGTSPIKGVVGGSCIYCHAPHSGIADLTPLWNQTLTTQTYTPYISTTYVETGNSRPPLGTDSLLCLSCHDGTVAPGQTIVYHTIPMTGNMNRTDVFGANLQSSHPFSLILPIKDSPDLVASLVAQGKTADPTGAVSLVNGNIECTSCHNSHVQAIDTVNTNFLVRDSSNGQMCLACHDPTRIMTGKVNTLNGWTTGIHALSSSKPSNQPPVGPYSTVALNSCSSCHTMHNAPGPARLLRGPNEQDCLGCHNGSNLTPAAPNVFAEFAKVGHPFTTGSSLHDAAEPVLLNQNRHSTCADCHNAHAANQVASFPIPPAIRVSQTGIAGISASDGITVLTPAVNQYENCLRCHGTSTGKVVNPIFGYLPVRASAAGDPLNVILQFSSVATSSHPVTHASTSPFPQPSLLSFMTKLDGVSQARAMGTQIFCSDCHNSDDNREFGGTGPNGPHGSKWKHILERRYEFSQTPGPGQLVTNLYPNPDLTVNGPFAMCGKCHDLSNQIMKNTSWSQHSLHLNAGFSCSTCHTAHGIGGNNANISGQRLVDFDVKVVAQNGAVPISYNRSSNSCALVCHSVAHNLNGTVTGRSVLAPGRFGPK